MFNVRWYGKILEIRDIMKYNKGRYECYGETDEKYSWSEKKVLFRAQAYLEVIGK